MQLLFLKHMLNIKGCISDRSGLHPSQIEVDLRYSGPLSRQVSSSSKSLESGNGAPGIRVNHSERLSSREMKVRKTQALKPPVSVASPPLIQPRLSQQGIVWGRDPSPIVLYRFRPSFAMAGEDSEPPGSRITRCSKASCCCGQL